MPLKANLAYLLKSPTSQTNPKTIKKNYFIKAKIK